jgi:deglycase
MAGLTGLSVGIVAADGVEQVEVTAPRDALRQAGASVRVLSPGGRDVRGYHYIEPGDMLGADGAIAGADHLDALILPGGLGGPIRSARTRLPSGWSARSPRRASRSG